MAMDVPTVLPNMAASAAGVAGDAVAAGAAAVADHAKVEKAVGQATRATRRVTRVAMKAPHSRHPGSRQEAVMTWAAVAVLNMRRVTPGQRSEARDRAPIM